MVGIFRMLIWNSIVNADPFVSMVVRPLTVVQHFSSFLDHMSQRYCCLFVLWIFLYVVHFQYYSLAQYCALNCCVSAVKRMPLVLFDCLTYSVLKYLVGSSVLKTEGSLDHLV